MIKNKKQMKSSKYIRCSVLFILTALVTSCATSRVQTVETQKQTTPEQALQALKLGNERFATGRAMNRNRLEQAKKSATGQYPIAAVVACLDSRTPPEVIFDQGIGDVFVARVAGNVVNTDIMGSLEFATKVSGAKAVVVVGHTSCGAVKGACDHVKLGNLTGLLDRISPAITATKTAPGEPRTSKNLAFVDAVAAHHVLLTLKELRRNSPILAELEKQGAIVLAGCLYDLETGRVHFLTTESVAKQSVQQHSVF